MSVLRRLTLLTLPFFVTACGAEESQAKTETPAQQVAPAAKQNFDEAALKAKFSKLVCLFLISNHQTLLVF